MTETFRFKDSQTALSFLIQQIGLSGENERALIVAGYKQIIEDLKKLADLHVQMKALQNQIASVKADAFVLDEPEVRRAYPRKSKS